MIIPLLATMPPVSPDDAPLMSSVFAAISIVPELVTAPLVVMLLFKVSVPELTVRVPMLVPLSVTSPVVVMLFAVGAVTIIPPVVLPFIVAPVVTVSVAMVLAVVPVWVIVPLVVVIVSAVPEYERKVSV